MFFTQAFTQSSIQAIKIKNINLMQFELKQINPKDCQDNVVFLYGNEVADRSLPLGKKELEYLKQRRADEKDAIVVFDRCPGGCMW